MRQTKMIAAMIIIFIIAHLFTSGQNIKITTLMPADSSLHRDTRLIVVTSGQQHDTIRDMSLSDQVVAECYSNPGKIFTTTFLEQKTKRHLSKHFGLKYRKTANHLWTESCYQPENKLIFSEIKTHYQSQEKYDWWLIGALVIFFLSLWLAWLSLKNNCEYSHLPFFAACCFIILSIALTFMFFWYYGIILLIILVLAIWKAISY